MFLGEITITPWHWTGFIICVLIFLALDLGVFHRKAHTVKFKEALCWTALWFVLAMGFAWALRALKDKAHAQEFLTGYLVELSLSMDNVFVIAMIFSYFRVPPAYQHRVLFWGILGALAMRGVMIGVGAALVAQFSWVLYIFGAFLVFTGIKMALAGESGVEPENNFVLKLARRFFPITPEFHGQKFVLKEAGRAVLTPLALVLLMVETTDLVFALDSIPAIFGITNKPFIIFTSNVFAILGLRSLYFVLANAIDLFRFLKYGLALVLVFIGVKMLIVKWMHIPTNLALSVVLGIILISILASLIFRPKKPAQ